MAQLVEQRIRNAQVVGSSPTISSIIRRVVRVVEGAALEMLCTQVPRVRIPDSPPEKKNRCLYGICSFNFMDLIIAVL